MNKENYDDGVYREMLLTHKNNVASELDRVAKELVRIGENHDSDKFLPENYNILTKHYPILKTFKWGSDEYINYQKKYLTPVAKKHAKCSRHHYNSKDYAYDIDVDLFDIFEILIDMRQSQLQYQPHNYTAENIISNMGDGKILNLTMEEVIFNTLKKIEELEAK